MILKNNWYDFHTLEYSVDENNWKDIIIRITPNEYHPGYQDYRHGELPPIIIHIINGGFIDSGRRGNIKLMYEGQESFKRYRSLDDALTIALSAWFVLPETWKVLSYIKNRCENISSYMIDGLVSRDLFDIPHVPDPYDYD